MTQKPNSDPFIELVLAMESQCIEAQTLALRTYSDGDSNDFEDDYNPSNPYDVTRATLLTQIELALKIAASHPEKYEALKTRMQQFDCYYNGGFNAKAIGGKQLEE